MNNKEPSFWSSLRAGLRGEERDYTSGRLGWAVALLAIPMVLEVSMQAVFEVVDIFFVGRLGAEAVAAAGLTQGLLALIYAAATGLSMATTAVVSRRIGERKGEEASRAAGQGLLLALLASLPFTLAGILFPRQLLLLMGATPQVAELGMGFCALTLGGSASVILLFVLNAVFRGAGDAAVAMRILWLANLLNIILDPIFIFDWGLGWGVTGAAAATLVGRSTAIVIQLILLWRGHGRVGLNGAYLRIQPALMRRMMRLAGTGILQYLVSTASWLAMVRIVAIFGSQAVAGYTIAVRLVIFAILPSWGLGNAAATLVGQNLGAKQPDRAEKSVWITSVWSVCFLALTAAVYLVGAGWMIRLFTDNPQVIAIGSYSLRIFSSSYVFLAATIVFSQAFNGAGDTWTPTWINFLGYWLLQVPLAYLFAVPLGLGENGVFYAIALAQATLAVVFLQMFRRGGWKLREV
ncbi:MAG TPA: MATE family efflux transporter [Acidobacteriota bacterium]|nr:MATE family efflux transporter [Acidobacteriota bacterium]